VLLDEGVPAAVAQVFQSHGHEVIPFEDVLKRGAEDTLVCRAAEANEAILVAFDRDMKAIAGRLGITGNRFRRLNLIHFQCPEPMAARRLEEAMSFVEHEWRVSEGKAARRLHLSIGTSILRSHR
jgi:predicted nuclease of predicted toxin-antitoxin system